MDIPYLKGEDYSGKRFGYKIPDGYEFDIVDNGKIILKPIKPKYPKTYKECRAMLDNYNICSISGYKAQLLESLQKLLACRDAYWKIAGDWTPEWVNYSPLKYCIICSTGEIKKKHFFTENRILAFPTEEMRDAFYENFKDLIEQCKELL